MSRVCVIGLPRQIRLRLEAALTAQDIELTSILADKDKSGRLKLVPDPLAALIKLREHCDAEPDGYDAVEVYVLPFAEIPPSLNDELDTIEDLGGFVHRFAMNQDGCPYLHHRRPSIDNIFLDQTFQLLESQICDIEGHDNQPPSACIRELANGNRNFLIAAGAIDLCDAVADLRYSWIRLAAESLAEIAEKNGDVGTFESYFESKNITHAKTGGISISLTVTRNGIKIYSGSINTHLKKGDATTPQSAARVYYHHLRERDVSYILLLYAGPHPEKDMKCEHELD